MHSTLTTMVFGFRELSKLRAINHPGFRFMRNGNGLKKRLILFLIFGFGLSGPPVSQGQGVVNVDSLLQELEQATDYIEKVELLNEISFQLRKNEELSEEYAKQALALAEEKRYKKGEGDAYIRLGIIAKNRAQYQPAEEYYFKALSIREDLGEAGPIINVYHNLGNLLKQQGRYLKALEYYEKGLEKAKGPANDDDKIKLLNGIANCHQHLGEYQKALETIDKDIALRKTQGDSIGLANALLTSGTIYSLLNNFSSAESKYKEGLSIFESQEYQDGIARSHINLGSLYHKKNEFRKEFSSYQKALSLKDALTTDGLALLYGNIGGCYKELEKPDSALFYYNKSIEIYQSTQNASGLAYMEFSFGDFYSDENQHQKALKHFTESLNILQSNQISDPILEIDLADRLADTYAELGDFKSAHLYRNQYSAIQDSLNTLAINAANYKYSYEGQQREIENLTHQTEIQHFEKMQLIILFIVIVVLLASGAGFALMIYQKREKKREIDDLLRDQEINTTYARMEGQDEERRRIAQDLHDRLGGMLSTVKLYFSAIDTKMDLMRMESREQYGKANQLLDEACEEVRKVSHDLYSGILKKFGLKAQLEDLAEKINGSKRINVELITHKLTGRMDTQLEVNIYRIIQELISNALKHAKASKLTVQLNHFDDIIHILVEDNGVGFKESAAMEKGGLGLSGVQTRVKALDGKIEIDSVLGRGTTISIDIPYKTEKALVENN